MPDETQPPEKSFGRLCHVWTARDAGRVTLKKLAAAAEAVQTVLPQNEADESGAGMLRCVACGNG